MELDLTTADTAGALKSAPTEPELFGTRPDTGRPHSLCLQGGESSADVEAGTHTLQLLVAVGIGAAMMYYLDPDTGARRRAQLVSDAASWDGQTQRAATPHGRSQATNLVASAIGTALTFLGGRRRDALGAAIGVLGSALLAGGVAQVPSSHGRNVAGPPVA